MYDTGFRQAALKVLESLSSLRKAAAMLGVSVSTLWRWRCGNTARASGPRATLQVQIVDTVHTFVKENPCTSCKAVSQYILDKLGIQVSRQLVHIVLRRRLGLTYKRTRKRGTSPNTLALRPLFLQRLNDIVQQGTPIVSIDESGFDQRCVPVYGYALRGQRAIVKWKTCKDHKRYSLIMALHCDGRAHHHLTHTSVKGSDFASFIESLPFERGAALLLDNASLHKTVQVKAAFESKGYLPVFIPPYSPEFNPIELMFGIIKTKYYASRYTDGYEIQQSIVTSLESSTTTLAVRNCFKHVIVACSEELDILKRLE